MPEISDTDPRFQFGELMNCVFYTSHNPQLPYLAAYLLSFIKKKGGLHVSDWKNFIVSKSPFTD